VTVTPTPRPLARAAERGFELTARGLAPHAWDEILAADPGVPTTANDLQALVERAFGRTATATPAEDAPSDCGMLRLARIAHGLRNPELTDEQIDRVDALIAAAMPPLERETVSEHFCVFWTTVSANPQDNTTEPIVRKMLDGLEHARTRLCAYFPGAEPYLGNAAKEGRLVCRLYDLGEETLAGSLPDTPIDFNARMLGPNDDVLATVTAHELLHRFQFFYGMLREYPLQRPKDEWFGEGLAVWAEMFVTGGTIRDRERLTWPFEQRKPFFRDSGYRATAMWTFFQAAAFEKPMAQTFLEQARAARDVTAAIGLTFNAALPGPDPVGRLAVWFYEFGLALGGWNKPWIWGHPPDPLYPVVREAMTGQTFRAALKHDGTAPLGPPFQTTCTWAGKGLGNGRVALFLCAMPEDWGHRYVRVTWRVTSGEGTAYLYVKSFAKDRVGYGEEVMQPASSGTVTVEILPGLTHVDIGLLHADVLLDRPSRPFDYRLDVEWRRCHGDAEPPVPE
jgi:hypothetical protein